MRHLTFPGVGFAVLTILGLILRLNGITRSLWLDEAWVANSVLTNSLADMFYYESWLQTSPPLFLILEKITVNIAGLSNASLRMVAFLFGLLAILAMIALSKRLLSPVFAILAVAVFVVSPAAIEYSGTAKQYSAELAVGTVILFFAFSYLSCPTSHRFRVLLLTTLGTLPLSYGTAFMLPGLALIVLLPLHECVNPQSGLAIAGRKRLSRTLIFVVTIVGILLLEFGLFVKPNLSPVLQDYWAYRGTSSLELMRQLPIPGRIREKEVVALSGFLLLLVGFGLAVLALRRGVPKWASVQILSGLPCLLLLTASLLSWYPIRERTSLFLLPGFILLLISSAQLISESLARRFGANQAALALKGAVVATTILVATYGSWREYTREDRGTPKEDLAAAVSYVQSHIEPRDLLFIHAACGEGFKLYAKMYGWENPPAIFGNTGWPCCPRGKPEAKDISSEQAVLNDLDTEIGHNFSGRVWTLNTARYGHWRKVGLDESLVMDRYFNESGCSEVPTPPFTGLRVKLFDCASRDGWGNESSPSKADLSPESRRSAF